MSKHITTELSVGRCQKTIARFKMDNEAKQEYCILIVDDDPAIRKLYKNILQQDGYVRVYAVSGEQEVKESLIKTSPDIILMDLNLGHGSNDGFRLMQKITDAWDYPTHFIVSSGVFNDEYLRKSMRYGAVDYIHKGNPEQLKESNTITIVEELKFKVKRALTYNVAVANFASADPLTGLTNKRTMYSEGGRRISDFIRNHQNWEDQKQPDISSFDLSLVLLDLDNFKNYNDTYGHMEGDYALKKLANFLQVNLRRSDLVCRFGGEEIVIILPNTPFLNALGLCNILSSKFKQIMLKPKDGEKISISFTSGIATWDNQSFDFLVKHHKKLIQSSDNSSLDALVNLTIQAADEELYIQKRKEKGICSIHNGFLPKDIFLD